MIRAILLDLDNTLLGNDMETFLPAYFALLSQYVAPRLEPNQFIRHLLQATEKMTANADPARTNREVFEARFFPIQGYGREEMEPFLADFYAHQFPQLRSITRPDPAARPLVEWVFERGFQVAIATNPLFPRVAVEQRLEWAGVPAAEFPYHLITSYENMHASKPHPLYFAEIAAHLDLPPEACLMVGDDWRMDIAPALSVGMAAYWIAGPDAAVPDEEALLAGRGSLADFHRWLVRQSGE